MDRNRERLAALVVRARTSELSVEQLLDEHLAADGAPAAGPRDKLSPRERQLVALLVEGLATAAIAERLGVTVLSVNTYVKRIFAKLGVHSRLELVATMNGTR